MINVEQVKRDVVNYGTLKVYTTFLTISEDEEDPELFNSNQLKEIFNSRFDIIKININFVEMQEDEWVSVAKELLVFKLSKCSNNEISYMSNVDDEGKLSSLVLTKSGDEVSLDVVEYSVGGSGGTKLYKHEIIYTANDWPNNRFTFISNISTEILNLFSLVTEINNGSLIFIKGNCWAGDILSLSGLRAGFLYVATGGSTSNFSRVDFPDDALITSDTVTEL